MDYNAAVAGSRYASQSSRGELQGALAALTHPFLRPNNMWVWRFLPGVVAGFILKALVDTHRSKKRPKSAADEEVLDGAAPQQVAPGSEVKLVMLVNDELKMTKGKIAAQCGHAVSIAMKRLMTSQQGLLRSWEQCGQPKIALRVATRVEMDALASQAEAKRLMVSRVVDAGRTQIPAGSHTVVAIGPGENGRIDQLTSHLRLL
eukprot:evm.model.scf_520.5 EVM.evm.TU.scf_520.5   scf_520:57060-60732(-)